METNEDYDLGGDFLLSLIIPIYNMEQYIPWCMGTILAQTCRDFEILLVDDGSTDGSGQICDAYAMEHPDFIQVIHKKNGGLSSARNAGIDAAKGEYIIFPDPDDWVEPDYVEKLLEYRRQYDADLVCIGYYVDTENSCVPVKQDRQSFMTLTGAEAQRALLLPPQMGGFAWNKLYRMNIIQKHGLRFLDDVGTTEDLDFAFRYLQHCKRVFFSPENRLYHYYQRSGAATHSTFSLRQLESIRTYEKMIAASTDEELIRAAEEEICNTAVNLIWSYQNSSFQDGEVWKLLRHYLKRYLKQYCTSSRYGCGRKSQAILAYCVPKIYVAVKNRVNQEV